MVLNAVASGLLSAGCSIVNLGVVPTPAVQFGVRELGLAGGAMVTASHNPPEFNGLKLFAGDGTELCRQDEERVESLVSDAGLRCADWNHVGRMHADHHIQAAYRRRVAMLAGTCKSKVVAVVDCANGTATGFTPEILASIGCSVHTINSRQDGTFPGRMPEPVRENLQSLMSAVRSHDAYLGIAHDGDADRAAFVDENGAFVTGDQGLAIFASDAISRRGGGTVTVPVTTSMIVQDAVEAAGGAVEYTAVGSPIIARRMMENCSVLGGEGNGGTIFPEHLYCRDGMMAAARMADIVSRGEPLSSLVGALPAYHTRTGKVRLPEALKRKVMDFVRKDAGGEVSEVDGVKSMYGSHWVLIRASGTEPIIRVMVESRDEARSESVLAERMRFLEELITGLS
jgi:phosphomannomutase/phosphoglucomutase